MNQPRLWLYERSDACQEMVFVSVFVSSPDTYSERKIESSQTIAQLKVSQAHTQCVTNGSDGILGQVDANHWYSATTPGHLFATFQRE